jgi:hypothetical protein
MKKISGEPLTQEIFFILFVMGPIGVPGRNGADSQKYYLVVNILKY